MHPQATRQLAVDLLAGGLPRRAVCRLLGVGYSSTYRWQAQSQPLCNLIRCFRCQPEELPPRREYLYLLGQYLGDGHIVRVGRTHRLDISCCDAYPNIANEVAASMGAVTGSSVHRRPRIGCTAIASMTNHWLCLFPQHGPGRKHERVIRLHDWQRDLVDADPRPLIRGLLHSDGYRGDNVVRRPVGGELKTYSYPRYLFSNVSTDIQSILTDALDSLGIEWRRNNWNSISVSRAPAVAALDAFVGPKT